MSRRSEGARLYLTKAEYKNGKLIREARWIIVDGKHRERTGCVEANRKGAEKALASYIARKYEAPRERGCGASEVSVVDVLKIYQTDVVPGHARPSETDARLVTLGEFWKPYFLSDVNGKRCGDYVKSRVGKPWKSAKPEHTGNKPRLVSVAAARRELEELRAAINYHRRQGLCSEIVSVALPPKLDTRDDDFWLTRQQAARLLWAAWRAAQVMQDKKTLRAVGKHLARFILVGLYTGTRHAAICNAALTPAIGRGYIDLETGVFHRRAQGARITKKRQPVVKLPAPLLAHIQRWARHGIAKHAVVEWNGEAIRSVRRSFASAVKAAGLDPKITPHVLRHTKATWLMQDGVDMWQAAGFLGMTVEMLQERYGHHHPDFQKEAAAAVGRGGRMRT